MTHRPATVDRPLPHDLPAERALLGAIIGDPSVLLSVHGLVDSADFYRPEHGQLFALLGELARAGVDLDTVTVGTAVLQRGHEAFGGAAYVAELPEHAPSTANARHYAATVRDAAVRRRALEVLGRITRAVRGETVADLDGEGVDEVLQRASALLASQSAPRVVSSWTLAEALRLTEAESLAAMDAGLPTAWPTGFPALDEMLGGGVRPGELVVIGGASSMGKSSLAMAITCHLAQHGTRVLYASNEPRRPEWAQRAVSVLSTVPLAIVRDPRIRTQEDWDALAQWEGTRLPMGLWYRPGMTLRDLEVRARRAALGEGLQVLVVDYLQLMRHERADRHDLAVGRTVGALKQLAGELGIAVVLLSQINREAQKGEMRGGPSTGRWWDSVRLPTLVDLRDSGSIEQDADVVIFPVRAEKAGPQRRPVEGTQAHEAVLVLAKQRNGPTGPLDAFWDGSCACYRPADDNRL